MPGLEVFLTNTTTLQTLTTHLQLSTFTIIICKLSCPKVVSGEVWFFSDLRYLKKMDTCAYEAVDTLSSLSSLCLKKLKFTLSPPCNPRAEKQKETLLGASHSPPPKLSSQRPTQKAYYMSSAPWPEGTWLELGACPVQTEGKYYPSI